MSIYILKFRICSKLPEIRVFGGKNRFSPFSSKTSFPQNAQKKSLKIFSPNVFLSFFSVFFYQAKHGTAKFKIRIWRPPTISRKQAFLLKTKIGTSLFCYGFCCILFSIWGNVCTTYTYTIQMSFLFFFLFKLQIWNKNTGVAEIGKVKEACIES